MNRRRFIFQILDQNAFIFVENAITSDAVNKPLGFLGIESRVFGADVNGRKRYRVYVGPISDLDRLNLLRSQLRAAGIDVLRITVSD